MRPCTNRMPAKRVPAHSADAADPVVATASVCRSSHVSLWLTPLMFAFGAGWISSLNGYGFYLPFVLAGLVAGAGIVALRLYLPTRVQARFLDPALVAFAISAVAMLVGIEFDLGPRGLAVLGSWCVTNPWSADDLLLAKLSLLPTAHSLMLVACVLHMLLTPVKQGRGVTPGFGGRTWLRRCQRCALVLVSLPLILLSTDALLLGASPQPALVTARDEWLSAAMVLTMAALMGLSVVVIQWFTSVSDRHQS